MNLTLSLCLDSQVFNLAIMYINFIIGKYVLLYKYPPIFPHKYLTSKSKSPVILNS